MCAAASAGSALALQPEDPSVKRASRHSPTLLAPTTIMAPVATQMGANGLSTTPLSPANPAFLAAAAAAAATGSPVQMPNMLGPVPLRPANFSPVTNLRDNPPCNTLFIGNLGDNTNEQELRALLSSQPGYRCGSGREGWMTPWVALALKPGVTYSSCHRTQIRAIFSLCGLVVCVAAVAQQPSSTFCCKQRAVPSRPLLPFLCCTWQHSRLLRCFLR